MPARVRPFVHGDADAVLRLYASVGEWFEDVGVNKEFIVSSSMRPDFRYMVAEDAGEVVGFIGALYFGAVGRAELGPVGVDENQRGAGVGAALMQAILGFLCEAGVRRVTVKVKACNENAVAFFLRQGFAYEAILRGYTLKGEDVVQLVRVI
jgi:ribosomal protein S18 acetylase RimI-like enzyme